MANATMEMSATLPEGLRIYAVGDIHGRLDLLRALYAHIAGEIADSEPARTVEIFLGDYVDRGQHSAGVIEWLTSDTSVADQRICLLGNHEDMLLEALRNIEAMPHWLANGGVETLLSYDVIPPLDFTGAPLTAARRALLAAMPGRHLSFLASLERLAEFPPYLFVHAGIAPGVPLERQDPHDLVWIRAPFLNSYADFGRIVVHGHTPVPEPDVRSNRINIDTGAVFSGRLTCLVLEGDGMRFLQAEEGSPPVPA